MSRNRPVWIAVLVASALAVCCCVAAAIAIAVARGLEWGGTQGWSNRVEASDRYSRSLTVDLPLQLEVDVPVGDVTVASAAGDRLVVDAVKRAWGRSKDDARRLVDRIEIRVEPSGRVVRVVATGLEDAVGGSGLSRMAQVDLTISVPAETQLKISSKIGKLHVTGTRGDVAIVADVGEIILTGVEPIEHLEVTSRIAEIEFQGPLVPQASYRLTSDLGRIDFAVLGSSEFSIDARSDVGDVEVSFDLTGSRLREGFIGKDVTGSVGSNPTTSLYLRSRVGDISVRPER